MGEDNEGFGQCLHIDDERIQAHLSRIIRGSVEETLNALLDAEADRLVGAPIATNAARAAGTIDPDTTKERFRPRPGK